MKNSDPEAIVRLGDLNPISFSQLSDGTIVTKCGHFDFNPTTGVASVSYDDPSIQSKTWQCNLVIQDSVVVGWAWPTAAPADLPTPDVLILDLSGAVTGRAYSSPIPLYFDVPVHDIPQNITYYAAAVKFPGFSYNARVDTTTLNPSHFTLTP